MCGRTALTASPEDLREIFGLDETPGVVPHYNVPPSQPLAVVRVMRDRRRTLELLRWGLVPSWADDVKIAHRLSLARVESVATTPAFREAVRRRRCLVVVDGFYEWRKDGKKASQPFFFRRPDGAPFALAGLWDRWVSKDGEVVESCAILTQAAGPSADTVHDRMPVVLEQEAWDRWLDPGQGDVASLLAPRDPELTHYPVSAYVNDPRHDDARCIVETEPEQRTLF
ncbi:MAG TPA: SOS response-associated peptidase [Polyangiaceae bacterium]|jgi:putative SOS response-associated peptidase YedK|nr:SOS response-associated peptidase [Polyangiaceae bacterium]